MNKTNNLEIKAGNKVGVFYYDDNRGTKARVEEIKSISPSGRITLVSGKRYAPTGEQIGINSLDASYLCSVSEANKAIEKAKKRENQAKLKRHAYLMTPDGKREVAKTEALNALIETLNSHGWYGDIDGEMDVMESEIGKIILAYITSRDNQYIDGYKMKLSIFETHALLKFSYPSIKANISYENFEIRIDLEKSVISFETIAILNVFGLKELQKIIPDCEAICWHGIDTFVESNRDKYEISDKRSWDNLK